VIYFLHTDWKLRAGYRTGIVRCFFCVLTFLLGVLSAGAQSRHLYTLVDLGTLGGSSSRAAAINNHGWVVGDSEADDGQVRAFIWTSDGAMKNLGTLGGITSHAYDLNDHGTVVGESSTSHDKTTAFIWTENEKIKPLKSSPESFYSVAFAINNRNQIVGSVEEVNGAHAVMWEDDTMRILRRLPGEGYVQPLDVNDLGDVVGQIQTRAGSIESAASHAYYFRRALAAENLTGFKLLSHYSGSAAVAVNNTGEAAGYVMTDNEGVRASRFSRADNYSILDDGNALFSSVSDINEQGDMCGSVIAAYTSDETASLWHDGRMFDLNEVTERPPDWHLVQATGINDKGQIAGYGLKGDNEHAFILEPMPNRKISQWPRLKILVADMTETQDTERILIIRTKVFGKADIQNVEFFANGKYIGTVYEAPYEWGWQGALDEEFTFTAEMTDTLDRHILSTAVSVKPTFQ